MKSFASGELATLGDRPIFHRDLRNRYTEVNSLLYKFNGIAQIRNLSSTEFEIDYEEYDTKRVVATLLLKINPDAESQFKRMVNAKVRDLYM